jgi:predicted TIM-barrel fold metal-dependent hydrolase
VTTLCQPPRPVTRRPAVIAPPGACDCHAHVFGPAARFPYAEPRGYTPPDASTESYRAMLDMLGFERAVIVQPSVYGFDNARTLGALAEFGRERARGIVMIDETTAPAQLREMAAMGVTGVRFMTMSKAGAPLAQLSSVAAKIAPLGWHLELHVASETTRHMLPQLLALPVPIVLDHLGQLTSEMTPDHPDVEAVLRLLASGRCWIKLSFYRNSSGGPPYDDIASILKRIVAEASERCLWGSDWPHPNISGYMPDDGELFERFAGWVSDAAIRKSILIDNPTALYFRS